MDLIDQEFLRTLRTITKLTLTSEIWDEVVSHYPDKYKGLTINSKLDQAALMSVSEDYYTIVKGYLRFYGIPILAESLCAGFMWGVSNLRSRGIENAPTEVKRCISLIKHQLQPQFDQLEKKLE